MEQSTATIESLPATWKDLSFFLQALDINSDHGHGEGESDDAVEERLRTEAKELGVNVDLVMMMEQPTRSRATTRPQSMSTAFSDPPRRSTSIESRMSASTGLTSHYSGFSSKDHQSFTSSRKRNSHVSSLSFRDYDAFLARGIMSRGRQSISFSPTTTPSGSVFSLPLSEPETQESSPKRHFKRLRGLNMLRRIAPLSTAAAAEDVCPHCPQQHAMSARRAIHKLPCGHRLCTQALRGTIKAATESRRGAIPSCCGRPLPGSLVEMVMTQEEQSALLMRLEEWDDAAELRPRGSIEEVQRQEDVREMSPRLAPPGPALAQAMQRQDYIEVLQNQTAQLERFLARVKEQRAALQEIQTRARESLKQTQALAVENLIQANATAMATAEDKQVIAESDMRDDHVRELESSTTALRHIESFCAGNYTSTALPHHRPVTADDLAALDTARRQLAGLPAKHANQINVLRGEQARRLKLRKQRQDAAVRELRSKLRREELDFECAKREEGGVLEENVRLALKRLGWRWEVQMAILGAKVELETGVRFDGEDGGLKAVEWQSALEGSVVG